MKGTHANESREPACLASEPGSTQRHTKHNHAASCRAHSHLGPFLHFRFDADVRETLLCHGATVRTQGQGDDGERGGYGSGASTAPG